MAVWHEVWIPAAAAGSLYVILMVGMLLMKYRCAACVLHWRIPLREVAILLVAAGSLPVPFTRSLASVGLLGLCCLVCDASVLVRYDTIPVRTYTGNPALSGVASRRGRATAEGAKVRHAGPWNGL